MLSIRLLDGKKTAGARLYKGRIADCEVCGASTLAPVQACLCDWFRRPFAEVDGVSVGWPRSFFLQFEDLRRCLTVAFELMAFAQKTI
ncbi:MAG: hypothetical protein ACKERG_03495 [Candidatus Hodgkinia cicadicola]